MGSPQLNPGVSRATPQWLPPAAILAGLAIVLVYAFRAVLAAGEHRLPGIDAASVHYPWEMYTRAALATGRLPHWDPYLFAGTPHLADVQTDVLYPPAMLLRWLPPGDFLSWKAVLHMWIGGAGALFLGRVVGLGWLGAAAAALAVGLGGTAASRLHNGHLLVINGVAWLPWVLALSIQFVRRTSLLPPPALAAVMVLQFLSGYPQGSLYITGAACLYFLYSTAWPETPTRGLERWRPLAQLATLGLLTVGLSAFQLLPTLRLAAEAARTAGIPYEAATEGGWTFAKVATVFWPFNGVEAEPPVRFVADRVAYVGWLLACAVPFAFLDVRRRRAAVFCLLLLVAAVVFAFGDNLPFYRLHYTLFPGLREPGRLLFIATLGLAVLGGLGLEQLAGVAQRREWGRLAVPAAVSLVAMCSATVVALVQWKAPLVPPVHGWPWLPVVAMASPAIVVWLGARVGARAALVAGLLVCGVDLTVFAAGGANPVSVESPETLRRWLGPPSVGRVYSLCENRIDSGGLLVTGRPALTGPVGVSLRDYIDWLSLLDTADRPSDALGPTPIRRDLLNSANVSTIVACQPVEAPSLTLVSDVRPVLAYRNDAAWPRAIWTCDVQELPRWQVASRLRRGRYEAVGRLTDLPFVRIRWAAGVSDEQRTALETRHRLLEGTEGEDRTWRYVLHDDSPENTLGFLRDPAVEDASGVDRHTGMVSQDSLERVEPRDAALETLIGTRPCSERGEVMVVAQDQPDGRVSAEVSAPVPGFVFLSEPYNPERLAFVDGRRAAARKANLGFTVVPVPAGRHHLELRYVPTSFRLGLGISGLALIVWVGLLVQDRARPVREARKP